MSRAVQTSTSTADAEPPGASTQNYATSNLAPLILDAALSNVHSGCSPAWTANAACRQSAMGVLA